MNEAEWRRCTDPKKMLKFLRRRANSRKLRLVAVACARRVVHLPYRGIPAEESDRARAADRHALAVAERFADNLASAAELKAALYSTTTNSAGRACTRANAFLSAEASADTFSRHIALKQAEWASEARAQANLLRCVCGNPFHTVTISPAILAWNDSAVVRLARSAYDERKLPAGTLDKSRLAVLSDALEEAGAPGELMEHLRSPGPHVRGCWPVDLCLGLS